MKLYKHNNYKEYVDSQIKTNKAKLNVVWVKLDEITILSEHINNNIPNIKVGICHGVRNGWEVKKLRELLNVEVIGTEISDTSKKFKHVIEWDFHEVKPEWINYFDFIYSNSFDHTYDHNLCLNRWMSCLKETGICYIHQTVSERKISKSDCLAASKQEYIDLFNKNYKVVDMLNIFENKFIFAIKNKKQLNITKKLGR